MAENISAQVVNEMEFDVDFTKERPVLKFRELYDRHA